MSFIISVDFEADGPCPGVNSMLQFGAVFYDSTGKALEETCWNVKPIPGAVQHKSTMTWWAEQEKRNRGIWERMTTNQLEAKSVVNQFEAKVSKYRKELSSSPLVVAYPAGFDFTYLYYYLCRFSASNESCVGFSCLDMKTLAMTLLQCPYHEAAKRQMPRSWFNPKFKHTHNALDDARGQGFMYFQMQEALKQLWEGNPISSK